MTDQRPAGDSSQRPSRGLLPAVVLIAVATLVMGGAVTLLRDIGAGADPSNPIVDSTTAQAGSAQASVAPAEDGFALWGRRSDGTAVRWDPCEPIRWVLNTERAPLAAKADVTAAMAIIEQASGLRFQFEGTTPEQPSLERSLIVRDGPAERWAPVLIAWVGDDQHGLPLDDDERGAAVPVAVSTTAGESQFVTGQIVLNAQKDLASGFRDRASSWGATILHELGHLVGLDHVDDAAELMYATSGSGPVTLGPGDRRGLAAVGAEGGCLPAPRARDLDVTYPARG